MNSRKAAQVPVRIGAVVLAAGGSARMGRVKQLIDFEGESLVRRAARSAKEAGADPVVVVLGSNADLIAPALGGLPNVTMVINSQWERGQASSLAEGLRAVALEGKCDGVLVTLADQPLVDAAALRSLIDTFIEGARIVAASYEGTIGVPALFGKEHLAQLMELSGDSGAGQWLRARRADVKSLPLANASVDVDTPADVGRLGRRSTR
jgi:CTP:molybdopterin cytidylyltransferase MocA